MKGLFKLLCWLFLTGLFANPVFAGYFTGESDSGPQYMSDIFYYGPRDSAQFCWWKRDTKSNVIGYECGTPNSFCIFGSGGGALCNGQYVKNGTTGNVITPPVTYNRMCVAPEQSSGVLSGNGKDCVNIPFPTTYTVDPTKVQPTAQIKSGAMLQANINGVMVTCVVGQSCDAVYDAASQKYVGLTYRVDASLSKGAPLNLNGTACQHLVNCQKMIAGGMVWPLGVYDLWALNSIKTAVAPKQAPSFSWVNITGGMPAGAVEIGRQGDGGTAYVCRVPIGNGVVNSGKLQWGNTCFYASFGKEYAVTQGYEVLVNSGVLFTWRPWGGGFQWDIGHGNQVRKAVVAGNYVGKPIVPCRTFLKGGIVGGHFWSGTCYVPYYGVEIAVQETSQNSIELLSY